MIDRAAMVLLWRGIQSGQKGAETLERWNHQQEETLRERVDDLDAKLRIFGAGSHDDELMAKIKRELERG